MSETSQSKIVDSDEILAEQDRLGSYDDCSTLGQETHVLIDIMINILNKVAAPIDDKFYVPKTGKNVDQILVSCDYGHLTRLAFIKGLTDSKDLDPILDQVRIDNYLDGETVGINEDGSIGLTYKCSQVVVAGLGSFYKKGKEKSGDGNSENLERINNLTTAIASAWGIGTRRSFQFLSESLKGVSTN